MRTERQNLQNCTQPSVCSPSLDLVDELIFKTFKLACHKNAVKLNLDSLPSHHFKDELLRAVVGAYVTTNRSVEMTK